MLRRRMLFGSTGDVPSGYTKVQYIESDGSNYINTGVSGKYGLSCEGRIAWVKIPSDATFIGSRAGNKRIYLLHYYQKPTYGYGNYYQCGTASTANTIYDFATVLNENQQSLTWNGVVIGSSSITTQYSTGLSMYIFALNYDGTAQFFTQGRLYYLKIYNKGELVRDYIPVRNSAGIYGLWDKVSRNFITSTGTALKGN